LGGGGGRLADGHVNITEFEIGFQKRRRILTKSFKSLNKIGKGWAQFLKRWSPNFVILNDNFLQTSLSAYKYPTPTPYLIALGHGVGNLTRGVRQSLDPPPLTRSIRPRPPHPRAPACRRARSTGWSSRTHWMAPAARESLPFTRAQPFRRLAISDGIVICEILGTYGDIICLTKIETHQKMDKMVSLVRYVCWVNFGCAQSNPQN